MTWLRQLIAGGALVLGLSTTSVISGNSTAGADQWDCTFYLMWTYHTSGIIVDSACNYGSPPQNDTATCVSLLQLAPGGLPLEARQEACRRAALP
jgi:hypothetical protein